jgi:hypothetical protein
VLQTLSAAADEKGYALMTKTHPQPVERIDRLDRAMGTQMDTLAVADTAVPDFTAAPAGARPPRLDPVPRKGKRRS